LPGRQGGRYWTRNLAEITAETADFLEGGAKSGALEGNLPVLADPGLARVVAVWPTLPAKVRAEIIVIVEAIVAADDRN
jgi:hypothetical protein